MSRSKTDDLLILTLGQRRAHLATKLENFVPAPTLAELQAEFDDVESRLVEIDPAIETLAQEAKRVTEERVAAEKVVNDATAAELSTPDKDAVPLDAPEATP